MGRKDRLSLTSSKYEVWCGKEKTYVGATRREHLLLLDSMYEVDQAN